MNPGKATSFYQRRPELGDYIDRDAAPNFAGESYANSVRLAENVRLKLLKILTLTLLHELEGVGIESRRAGEEFNLQNEVDRFESELIRSALIMTGGGQRRAARLLGMKVTTLHTKIRRYGLNAGNTSQLIEANHGVEPTAVEAVRTSLELVESIFESDKHPADHSPEIHVTGEN
jgi:hypothetical protein